MFYSADNEDCVSAVVTYHLLLVWTGSSRNNKWRLDHYCTPTMVDHSTMLPDT